MSCRKTLAAVGEALEAYRMAHGGDADLAYIDPTLMGALALIRAELAERVEKEWRVASRSTGGAWRGLSDLGSPPTRESAESYRDYLLGGYKRSNLRLEFRVPGPWTKEE